MDILNAYVSMRIYRTIEWWNPNTPKWEWDGSKRTAFDANVYVHQSQMVAPLLVRTDVVPFRFISKGDHAVSFNFVDSLRFYFYFYIQYYTFSIRQFADSCLNTSFPYIDELDHKLHDQLLVSSLYERERRLAFEHGNENVLASTHR